MVICRFFFDFSPSIAGCLLNKESIVSGPGKYSLGNEWMNLRIKDSGTYTFDILHGKLTKNLAHIQKGLPAFIMKDNTYLSVILRITIYVAVKLY